MEDRPTNQPTDQQTDIKVHRCKVEANIEIYFASKNKTHIKTIYGSSYVRHKLRSLNSLGTKYNSCYLYLLFNFLLQILFNINSWFLILEFPAAGFQKTNKELNVK